MAHSIYDSASLPLKLLIAAEREFAINGEKARVSDILARAESGNAAAVNYHFRSRDGLFAACRIFREQPLNEFRKRLLDRLLAEATEESPPTLAEYFFVLIAPSVAVITSLLPEAYYGRFICKCDTYSRDRLDERRHEIWAEPALQLVEIILAELSERMSPSTLELRLALYERNIPQSLAQLETYLMGRIESGVEKEVIVDQIPGLIAEIARHSLYSFIQDKNTQSDDLSRCERLYREELQAFGSFVYRAPDRMSLAGY
ncbi:AcrR family transcriptional regulator [Litorivivens lipolytica]|uniref:AcrR family transcriptional regulator n=1 Tax=Litorivivens lipolytica TaxID=1524264 RepID=A0A7W4Z6R7_9GAMM|nr:hypothetical protein [Litorivivens lipolytica]MBB3047240.1 AcrR family transcriptional regulator [Litorivivens lipolytica]